MSKNLKIQLGLAVIIILAIIGFRYFNEKTNISRNVNDSVAGCYVATLGQDVYSLKIASQKEEIVEGTLVFKNFQKDSSSGTYNGTYKNGILLGEYSFNSEGMASRLQFIFKKSEDGFVRGFGEMDESGTRFADLNNITYDLSYIFKASPTCVTSL